MGRFRWRPVLLGVGGLLVIVLGIVLGVVASQLPSIGAAGLLYPARRRVVGPPPPSCQEAAFSGEGVTLKGWQCRGQGVRRGTLVYLHGIADNRASGTGVIQWFGMRGFDVVAYDSRANSESGGDVCTYGYFEKQDLHRVLDTVAPGPIVLFGTSLGAAVALQEAPQDLRVTAVVAAEAFSDLRRVATERSPFFFTAGVIERAFRIAEPRGQFQVDAVSPVTAASHFERPVLLIHGGADADTPPDHSRRIFAALTGPRRLIIVPGARHNESLRGAVWTEIEQWLDEVLGRRAVGQLRVGAGQLRS